MPLIHHVATGVGRPPFMFIHGFGCDHGDWDAQVAHLSPRHQTVAVDLRGHGASPGSPADCTIERHGADVAEVMCALALPPAILVGHSMGCRVAVEAALQAPDQALGLVLVDGSQFAAAMAPILRSAFAQPNGFATMTEAMFKDMFTPRSAPAISAAIVARARAMPRAVGEKMLTDLQRYDVTRWTASLACLRVPVLAIQTTYSNEKRERSTMRRGQTTPYLDMLRGSVPAARIEIIEDTGHFPQRDAIPETNRLLDDFVADL
jgi:pimeloyl-ACP methyl ester carboxylesterase